METLICSSIATLGISYYLKSGYLLAGLIWCTIYTLLSTVVPFTRNIFVARRTGFPSVFIPWHPHSVVWMVCEHPITPFLERWLPAWLWARISLAGYGWEFRQRLAPFEKYAAPQGNRKSFMSVSFNTQPELYTWDAEIISQVLARPDDFQCDEFTALFMNRFGRNLLTSNGDAWHRQRKVVAGVINEKISKAVFNESVQQTRGLIDELFENTSNQDSADTNKMFDMLKKIAIRVLSGAGMGKSAPWDDRSGEAARPGFKMNYMESVKIVTESVAGPIILPQWFLDNYPRSWPGAEFLRTVGVATREFPEHTRYALDQERQRNEMSKSGETRSNIMSQMLQALNRNTSNAKGPALHEDELTGNLFIFTVAGFDTTANTLSFTLMMLARHPEWQEWIFEEIKDLLPSGANPAELEYSEIHPRATRALALMYEVLRLFPPIVHIVKQTHGEQTIPTSTGTYHIPHKTAIYMTSVGVQLDSDVYRNINIDEKRGEKASNDDEYKFRPSRWLNGGASAKTTHFQPPKGSFIPWSMGPRVCPGMKMAQVEFVAVILMLLRDHHVEAVPLPGESRGETEQRLDAQTRKSISKLTLEMVGVYDIVDAEQGFKLRLSKRKTS